MDMKPTLTDKLGPQCAPSLVQVVSRGTENHAYLANVFLV